MAHFVLDCPLYNINNDKFQSLFPKVVLGSLEFYFQLDHWVDTSLYLKEAITLHHFRGLAILMCF